ncbi:hypothetical protein, partial [Vibrio sp. 10N.222.49.C9]|uniref:hypothetical protein n=1 Tax=Vibrio sp. 10N.222.49.C9 TaxID=3229615 RepID=UPI00355000EF
MVILTNLAENTSSKIFCKPSDAKAVVSTVEVDCSISVAGDRISPTLTVRNGTLISVPFSID